MNESVLELVQGIFNTFLFVMSVAFSMLLLGVVMQRSASMDFAGDNRIVYKKEAVEDSVYTIKGSSIIDTVCKVFSGDNDTKVTVSGVVLGKAILSGIYVGEPEDIAEFYELIDADKEYKVSFGYDDMKSLEITEADE